MVQSQSNRVVVTIAARPHYSAVRRPGVSATHIVCMLVCQSLSMPEMDYTATIADPADTGMICTAAAAAAIHWRGSSTDNTTPPVVHYAPAHLGGGIKR